MPAYKIHTGTNTAGTWHAELRADPDDPNERRLARTGFQRKPIGVVNGYGIDEATAVADAIRKAGEALTDPERGIGPECANRATKSEHV